MSSKRSKQARRQARRSDAVTDAELQTLTHDVLIAPYAHRADTEALLSCEHAYENLADRRSREESQRVVQMACICAMALVALLTFGIWRLHSPQLAPSTVVPETGQATDVRNASEVTTVSVESSDIDEDGRAFARVTVQNDADESYVIRLTADVTVDGIDERGEAWEGKLENVRVESFDEGCVWDGTALAISELGAHQRRTIDLYPSLADTSAIRGVKLTSIHAIEIVTQTATPTASETCVAPMRDTSLSASLTDDGDVIHVYGTVSTKDVPTTGGVAYVALVARNGSLPAGTTDDMCEFSYGCGLRAIRFACDERDTRASFGESFATGGEITRAKLVGVVFD